MASKDEIRQQILQKRKALSLDVCNELSYKLADNFFYNFHSKLLTIRRLHLFLPIEKNREPNTNFIVKILLQRFKKLEIVVPITHFKTGSLQHILISEQTDFINNSLGIPEPVGGQEVAPHTLDLVLVPLLAINSLGHRIGYGGGFYDKFLASTKPDCIKVGLSIFDDIQLQFDSETTDIALDYCVCPNNFFKF